MKRILLIAFILGLVWGIANEAALPTFYTYRIVDGDTFEQGDGRYRIADIDAPELSQGEYGRIAKEFAENNLRASECTFKEMDVYGRKVMHCPEYAKRITEVCLAYGYGEYATSECRFNFENPRLYRKKML